MKRAEASWLTCYVKTVPEAALFYKLQLKEVWFLRNIQPETFHVTKKIKIKYQELK